MKFKDIINKIDSDPRTFEIRVFENGNYMYSAHLMGDLDGITFKQRWLKINNYKGIYGDFRVINMDYDKLIIDLESGDRG